MRMYSASGRSRWPWVIGTVVVVAAVIGGVAFAVTHQVNPTHPTATHVASPSPTPTHTGGSSGAGDTDNAAPPTGCLGGLDRNAAMVLAAQKAAGHNAYGAVEVATAFVRFISQSPVPSADDVSAVSKDIISSSAPAGYRDLAATFSEYPNASNGVVPDGTPFHLSTTNGVWLVDPSSTADRVTVDIQAGYVINGALSATKTTATGVVMVWEGDGWHVAGGVKPDASQLAVGGTQYTGGC